MKDLVEGGNMKDYKKIASFFLALVMLLGTVLQPFPAFAIAENSEEEEIPYRVEMRDGIPYQSYKYEDIIDVKKPKMSFFAVGDPIPEFEKHPVNVVWTTYDFKPTDLTFELKFFIQEINTGKIIGETKQITERGSYYFYRTAEWDDADVSHDPYDWDLLTPKDYKFDIRLHTSAGGFFEDGDTKVTISQKASSIYKAEYFTNEEQNPLIKVKRQNRDKVMADVAINETNLNDDEYYTTAVETKRPFYYDGKLLNIKHFFNDTDDQLRISDKITAERVKMFVINPDTQEVNQSGEFTDTANGDIKYVYNVTGNYKTDHIISVRQKLAVKFDENGGTWKTEKPNTQYIGHSMKIGEEFGSLSKVVVPDGTNELIPPPVGEGETNSFKGWNTDKNATEGMDLSQYEVKDNVTFYAIYEEQGEGKAQVRYVDNNGQSIELTENNKITGQDYITEKTGDLNTPIDKDIFTAENAPKLIGYKFNRIELNPTDANYTADGKSIIKIYYDKLNDVIPGTGPETGNENTKPDGYVTVKFDLDGKGTTTDETVYYVNPKAGKTNADLAEPAIKANIGYKVADTKWSPVFDTTTEITEDATYTAQYDEISAVIPGTDSGTQEPNEKPDGYVTVKFDLDGKGTTTDETVYYINPKATNITGVKAPNVTANTGYKFKSWDSEVQTAYTQDTTHKALYDTIDNIIEVTNPEDPPMKPDGYVTVKFLPGEGGTLEGTTEFYVNPTKVVDLTNKAPTVTVKSNLIEHKGWTKELKAQFETNTDITAVYIGRVDNVKGATVEPATQTKPEGAEIDKITITPGSEKANITVVTPEGLTYNENDHSISGIPVINDWQYGESKRDIKVPITVTNTDGSKKIEYAIITVIKAKDVVPQTGEEKPTVPANYVQVQFLEGKNGKISAGQTTIYWVNPIREVTLTAPDLNANLNYQHTGWEYKLGDVDKTTKIKTSVTDAFASNTDITASYMKTTCMTTEALKAQFEEAANAKFENVGSMKDVFVGNYDADNHTVTVAIMDKEKSFTSLSGTGLVAGLTDLFENNSLVKFKIGNRDERDLNSIWKNSSNNKKKFQQNVAQLVGMDMANALNVQSINNLGDFVDKQVSLKLTVQEPDCDNASTINYTVEGKEAISSLLRDKLEAQDIAVWVNDEITWKDGVKLVDSANDVDKENFSKITEVKDSTEQARTSGTAGKFPGKLFVKFEDGSYTTVENQMLYVSDRKVTNPTDEDKLPDDAITVEFKAGDGIKGLEAKVLKVAPSTKLDKSDFPKATIKEGFKDPVTWTPKDLVVTETNKTFTAKATEKTSADKINELGGLNSETITVWVGGDIDWKTGVKAKDEANATAINELLANATVTDKSNRNSEKAGSFAGTLEVKFEDGSTITVNNQLLVVKKTDDVVPQTGDEKPDVPDNFVEVKFLKGDYGTLEGTTIYWVNPDANKTLADITKPTVNVNEGYKHTGWDKEDTEAIGKDGLTVTAKYEQTTAGKVNELGGLSPETITVWVGEDINWKTGVKATNEANAEAINELLANATVTDESNRSSDKAGTFSGTLEVKFEDGSIVTVNNQLLVVKVTEDIVEQPDPNKKPDVPSNFVEVKFLQGDHGSLEGTTIYWVNPEKEVTVNAPGVKANYNWKHTGWTMNPAIEGSTIGTELVAVTAKFTEATTITAAYMEKVLKEEPAENADKYVTVEFLNGDHGTLEGTTEFWVLKDTEVKLTEPTVTPKGEYTFTGWDKPVANMYSQDVTYTAQYQVDSKIMVDPSTEEPLPGYVRLIFDATDDGRLGTAEGKQTRVLDVKKDTPYADSDLMNEINKIKPVPVVTEDGASNIDGTKVFDQWNPLVPTTGYVKAQEFTATYKVKEADAARVVIESEQRYDDSTDRQYIWGKIELAQGETAPRGTQVTMVDSSGAQITGTKAVYVDEDGTFEINIAGTNLKHEDTVYFVASEPGKSDSEKGAELALDLKGPEFSNLEFESDLYRYQVKVTGLASDESGILRVYVNSDKDRGIYIPYITNDTVEIERNKTVDFSNGIVSVFANQESVKLTAVDRLGNKTIETHKFVPEETAEMEYINVYIERPWIGDDFVIFSSEEGASITIEIQDANRDIIATIPVEGQATGDNQKVSLKDANGTITLAKNYRVTVTATINGKKDNSVTQRVR